MQALDPNVRLPDGGTAYAETDLSALIKEPWNTASLIPFALIIGYWVWQLRGRWREQPVLSASIGLMVIGLVGGMMYHGTRSSVVWLVMDFVPIALSVLLVAMYFWVEVGAGLPRVGRVAMALLPFVTVALGGAIVRGLAQTSWPLQTRINVNYSLMASAVLLPIGIVLVRTRGAHGRWMALALGCFAGAVACRALDRELLGLLPMGTHWLWHVLGASASWFLSRYLYAYVESRRGAAVRRASGR